MLLLVAGALLKRYRLYRSIDKNQYSHADEVLILLILLDSLIVIESIKIILFLLRERLIVTL